MKPGGTVMNLRLPVETIAVLKAVARISGQSTDDIVSVVITFEILRHEQKLTGKKK